MRARVLAPFFLSASLVLSCSASPVTVQVPRPGDLHADVVSVQMIAKPHLLGILSPRPRYAREMRAQLKNELIARGFVIKSETAELHIVAELLEITTGGSQNRAECELRVDVYATWPGDLLRDEKAKAHLGKEKSLFSFRVQTTERKSSNAESREAEVRQVAKQAVLIMAGELSALEK